MRPAAALLAGLVAVSGCGYSNALYHARHSMADAERAARRGDSATAARAWRDALDAAAASYRSHPDGRRAADALLLVGRAHFELGDDTAAAAALRHLLGRHAAAGTRPAAHAWLGAALARADSASLALPHLDSAVATLPAAGHTVAVARLWRGRARMAVGRVDEAGADLDAAALQPHTAADAALALGWRAVALTDSAAFRHALDRLAAAPDITPSAPVAPVAPELERLVAAAVQTWTPAFVVAATARLEGRQWPSDIVQAVTAFRSLLAARALLDGVTAVSGLDGLPAVLAPVADAEPARALLRAARATALLAGRADGTVDALSMFAAAEVARDELGADRLAHRLFLDFAALDSASVWAGKAVLAAHALHPGPETLRLLRGLHDNVYVRAAHGLPAGAELGLAEERLARGLLGLRAAALADSPPAAPRPPDTLSRRFP
jgi:tetratricopeptide (TPR) repeat protein